MRAVLERSSSETPCDRDRGGDDWEDAIEDVGWEDGDVLVVGSSSAGPIARVFLGSHSAKIVRHSPVPVVVVPRGAIG